MEQMMWQHLCRVRHSVTINKVVAYKVRLINKGMSHLHDNSRRRDSLLTCRLSLSDGVKQFLDS